MEATIWGNIARALGAEPREYPMVTGTSGIEHQFLSIAVDETAKRIILVSAEPDPRITALTQVDIQATFPESRVLIARPIAIDLGFLARALEKSLGSTEIRLNELTTLFNSIPKEDQAEFVNKFAGGVINRISAAFKHVTLPTLAQIITVIQQAANIDWPTTLSSANQPETGLVIPLRGLLESDNLATDRKYGICPIPLYELTDDDWELLNSRDDIDEIKRRLRELGIYQYFFPAADELALGFVDRGVHSMEGVARAASRTAELGHQISSTELVHAPSQVGDIIDALQEAEYLVEGEVGLNIGPNGNSFRLNVKFRPQEGLFDKVLKRLNVNVGATIDPTHLIK